MAGLKELKKVDQDLDDQTVFIAIATDKARAQAFKLLQELRKSGLKSDIALKTNKLANQFKHANRQGYPVVVTLGDDEIANETASVKIMATGEEKKRVPQSKLVDTLKGIIKM